MTIETAGSGQVSHSAARLRASLLQLAEKSIVVDDGRQATLAERMRLLSSSSPLIGQLRGLNRSVHDQSREGKRKVTEARLDVDQRSLALQNLKYQKRHLEEEIRKCRDFRSIYQTIPLTNVDDFKSRAPAEDTTADVLGDEHALQLARLRFELSERKRLEGEKQAVQTERGILIIENKGKKQRLEALERDLKEMLNKCDAIWQHFEEAKPEVESTAASQSADTPRAAEEQG